MNEAAETMRAMSMVIIRAKTVTTEQNITGCFSLSEEKERIL